MDIKEVNNIVNSNLFEYIDDPEIGEVSFPKPDERGIWKGDCDNKTLLCASLRYGGRINAMIALAQGRWVPIRFVIQEGAYKDKGHMVFYDVEEGQYIDDKRYHAIMGLNKHYEAAHKYRLDKFYGFWEMCGKLLVTKYHKLIGKI